MQAAPGRSVGALEPAGAADGTLGPSSASSSKLMEAIDAAESWLLNTQFAASTSTSKGQYGTRAVKTLGCRAL